MLYTRKGDTGTTKTLNGEERISKAALLPETLGTLDELNSFLGLCRSRAQTVPEMCFALEEKDMHLADILRDLQENLFIVQAEVAGARDKSIEEAQVGALEAATDAIEAIIPPLGGFCIAGGTELSAHLDIARTLVRRAERRVVACAEEGSASVSPGTLAWLNRLSSLLFALARLANFRAGIPEAHPHYQVGK